MTSFGPSSIVLTVEISQDHGEACDILYSVWLSKYYYNTITKMAESSTQNINPETREHSPLDKIISETQKPNQQLDRWSQGCQAIFAGFVASAHLQNVSSPPLINRSDEKC